MEQTTTNQFLLKKLILIILLVTSAILQVYSQELTITGRIFDTETNEPMPGVNIIVKGTTLGTISDVDGNFSITATKGDELEFSFIGYLTQTMLIENEIPLTIALEPDAKELDEVVVVGYGVMKKSDLTGSVVSIREEDLTAIPATNALEVLQGKVAGLDLTRESGQTGSGISMKIRGRRSLVEDYETALEPLIIVDGVQYGSNLDINPNDIASIEVLKDASSTAIYGSRGANGVILITTKKGASSNKTRVTFNAYYGKLIPVGYPEFNIGQDYMNYRREAYRASGEWESAADDSLIFSPYDLYSNNNFVDWRDLLINDGRNQNYHLSISGGDEKTRYLISTEYNQEQGIFENDNLNRYNGRLNLDHSITKWLNVGSIITYNYTTRDIRDNPLNLANKSRPVGIPYNNDGTINIFPTNDPNIYSPLMDEVPEVRVNEETRKRFFSSSYVEIKPITDLSVKSTISFNIDDRQQGQWADSYTIKNMGGLNSCSIENESKNYLLWENILSYTKTFGIHTLQVTTGNSLSNDVEEIFNAEGRDLPVQTFSYHNLAAAESVTDKKISSDYIREQMVSFFGRLHYKLLDRYIFQVSLRSDGASQLAPKHKWASFPSASFAWKLSEESFMKSFNLFSMLKLRASYGISGNSSIRPYDTQSFLGITTYTWDDELAAGYYPRTISAAQLGWETTATTDFGLDFGFYKNRITGSIDVYKQRTYNLLLERELPATNAYFRVYDNIGETENKGIEITIGTVNLNTPGGFKWTSDFSYFANIEKITKLHESDRDFGNFWFVGEPIDVFYSYEKLGIWQQEDSALAAFYGFRPGDIRLKDQNHDGKIDEKNDRVIIGTERPKWSGGLKNAFYFKGFELSCFIYARMGQTIEFEGYVWDGSTPYWYNGDASGVKVDYWTPENPTNEFPRPDARSSHKFHNAPLKYVDGSYIKIRDLTFGYSLPTSIIDNIHVSNIRFYTTFKNYFFLYRKIDDYDPERGGRLSFPMLKEWLVGINLEF